RLYRKATCGYEEVTDYQVMHVSGCCHFDSQPSLGRPISLSAVQRGALSCRIGGRIMALTLVRTAEGYREPGPPDRFGGPGRAPLPLTPPTSPFSCRRRP